MTTETYPIPLVTEAQIHALLQEAREHDDTAQFVLCRIALGEDVGDVEHDYDDLTEEQRTRLAAMTEEAAWAACARAIAAGQG